MTKNHDSINTHRRAALSVGATAILAAGTLAIAPMPAAAAADPIYTGFLSNKAVSGYDPVAYFTDGKPVKGSKKFTLNYQGAEWLFASQANLDTFQSDPEKYAPQYGGYCAYAVGIGQTAKGDPENWDIVDGKLYLNYDGNTQNLWHQKQAEYIKQGDINWPGLIN